MAFLGSALLVLSPFVLALCGIDPSPPAPWVTLIFSVNLLFASIGHINNYLLQFGKDTSPLFPILVVRSIVVTAFTVALVPRLESIGAALAVLTSNLLNALMYACVTRDTKLWTWKNNIYQGLAGAAITALWCLALTTVY